MPENEKKKPEEEVTPQGEQPQAETNEKPSEPKTEDSEKPSEKPQEGENDKGKELPYEQEKPPESESEGETEAETAPPELSEEDRLKEENFRLKTQLEAMKIGFNPDVIEDAVILAENIVKRDDSDIATALKAVAKKYPDWKADSSGGKSKGGFKVGADSSGQSSVNDEKLNKAFGLKKKG